MSEKVDHLYFFQIKAKADSSIQLFFGPVMI